MLGTDCESDSAPGRKLRGYDGLAWRAGFHEVVQNAVRHRFVKGTLIPIRSEIKLERFAFDAELIGDVIDIDSGKVWLACDWTNRSEIVGFEMNPIIAAWRGILESLQSRLHG